MNLIFITCLSVITTFPDIHSSSKSFFNYSDSSFEVGQVKRFMIYFNYNNGGILTTGEQGEHNTKTLDSLTNFLLKHPNIKVEIGNHTDFRGNNTYNLKLSERRSYFISVYLKMFKEIRPERYTYKGYGETKPIITETEIKKIENKEEAEKAISVNRRCELKIIAIQ